MGGICQSIPCCSPCPSCVSWGSLWHCSLSGQGGQAALTDGWVSVGCGGGRAALQLGWCWCPLGWCQGRLGHSLSVELLAVSGGVQTVPAGCWRVEECDREAGEPGKIGVSQGSDRAGRDGAGQRVVGLGGDGQAGMGWACGHWDQAGMGLAASPKTACAEGRLRAGAGWSGQGVGSAQPLAEPTGPPQVLGSCSQAQCWQDGRPTGREVGPP